MVQAGHGTGQSKTISGVGHSLLAGCLARGKRIVLFYLGGKHQNIMSFGQHASA